MAVCGAAAAETAEVGRRWYFTREQLARSPSRRAGLDPDKELSYRQQAANLLQDMGQRLNVSQLTINTAIVYMHRFYMVQSFTQFHRNSVAPAALFLAAKVEEQPRKLEHVIKVAHACLHHQEALPDTRSEAYLQQAQDLVILESIILQTLGFEITIDHPHTHVVKCTQLVRASKDLAQTSYFMATNSLHLTTFSLQYTPPVVACVCIHLACKWSNWEIPVSTDGKHWWEYVDGTVTLELLDELTHEFLQILEKTPNRLKRIRNWRACQAAKKSKTDEQGDDDCLSEQTILNMISRSASDMTIAGLMSMSTSSTSGAMTSLSATSGDSPGELGSTDAMSAESWIAPHVVHKLEVSHRANEISAGTDHSHHDNSSGSFSKQNIKSVPLAKVSLKEYRAKHAEELAAQKRQLENMEANVRSQYAYAAQNLLVQQQRERDVQQENNPSPIILKIPLGSNSDGSERPSAEKADKPSPALKVRLPAPVDKPAVSSSKPEEIKMRIKVPTPLDRHSSSDESSGKNRGEHKEKHKLHSSNHHHHHNHHSHKHSHVQAVASTKRPGDSKHGNQSGIASHKVSYVPTCSSRKRPLPEDTSAAAHEPLLKVSKNSKGPAVPFPFPQHAGHSLDTTGLPFSQGSKARGAHGKLDKSTAGANGHNMNQAIDYQDTVNMLHSLLSAQGMQPTQPPSFDFVHSYGEYLNPRAAASGDKPRPPPLPSEPPPPLPPLPK
ncbi:cyclin-T1 isoform X1 [Anolis carolinensis]|uniref:Cyclin-T1 n=2 Tax=Anolis carolinensis TaxID=28377 RepID=G1KI49_ANOCA|nr:PREDICTED: cyclin-T1 [Anolis carolinensis]|eukprot:XP_003217061.1 PREDICTED: cyclin-T1 [Anolis carolinensis]